MSAEPIEVKFKVLKLLYKSLLPYYYRLESVLDDITVEKYSLSAVEKSVLLEHLSYSIALKNLFEDYFDQMREADTDKVFLKQEEYINILSMAKTVESSSRVMFGNFGLWTH